MVFCTDNIPLWIRLVYQKTAGTIKISLFSVTAWLSFQNTVTYVYVAMCMYNCNRHT